MPTTAVLRIGVLLHTVRMPEATVYSRVRRSAAAGSWRQTGNDTEVRYFLTDHLGSVRVVATDKDNVLERNDYQPFGNRWDTAFDACFG